MKDTITAGRSTSRWGYTAIILGAALGMFAGYAPLFNGTAGVFMRPVAAEFHWGRSEVALSFAACVVVAATYSGRAEAQAARSPFTTSEKRSGDAVARWLESSDTIGGRQYSVIHVEPLRADGMQVYSAKAGDDPFTLVVIDKTCSDTMSGMPHPQSVVVAIGDKPLVGCGGEPVSLLLGDWQVAEIGGKPVIAGSGASLTFDLDGSLHGNASCNRFFGSFTLTGEGLAISDIGATLMACEAAAMDQEQRFLSALGTVQRFESPAEGTLRLMAADGSAALTLHK